MADRASLRVRKQFAYRGGTKQFSNRYYFSGGTPPSTAAWTTLSDAVVTAEKVCYTSVVTIIAVDGFEAGSDLPIFTKSYSTAGTSTPANRRDCPGDCAAVVKFNTDARSVKNHPIYLFNYYHAAMSESTSTPDTLNLTQKGHLEDYALQWITGFSDGSTTYHRCGPRGAVALSRVVNPLITHRDFRR